MLTKQEVEEILADDIDINSYLSLKANLTSWKLESVSSDTVLWVMIHALSKYEKIIKHILDKLDESSS